MNKTDFPLLKKNIVYLDNAATTQKPQFVIDAIVDYYNNWNSNVHRGIYNLSEETTKMFEDSRKVVAKFINAKSNEIIFTSGTTDGLNMIAELLEYNGLFGAGDVILTTPFEHHSNFLPWQRLAKQHHCILEFVKMNDDFGIDIEYMLSLASIIKPKVIALAQISNVLGTIIPIKEFIFKIKKILPDSIIIVDAAQSIAHLEIDVNDLDCDFLVFSGHKVYGPTGIGVIYAKEKMLNDLKPVRLGGGIIEKVTKDETTFMNSPHRFEAGTPNIEGAIGLRAAINYIKKIGFENILKYEKELCDYTYSKLKDIEGIQLYCSSKDEHIGVFSFNIKGIHPHDLAQILDESNICVRAGHHCAQILHRDILKVSATVRVSLSFYNDKSDIDLLVEKIIEARNRLRK